MTTPITKTVCRGVYASLDGTGDEKVTEAEVCDAAEERGLVLTDEQAFLTADGEADAGDGGVNPDEQLTGIDGRVQGTYEGRRTTHIPRYASPAVTHPTYTPTRR